MNQDEENIFTLKYRYFGNESIETFVKECVQNSENLEPYLENSDIESSEQNEQSES